VASGTNALAKSEGQNLEILGSHGVAIPSLEIQNPKSEIQNRGRRRWRRRLIIAGATLALIAIFHAPLFRLLASGLIVDDPPAKTDAVIFGGRNGPFAQIPLDEVAELYRNGMVSRVILVEDTSSRIVRQGILPNLDSVVRRELPKRGVPTEAITTLFVDGKGERDGPMRLKQWLQENRGMTATIVRTELSSREGRLMCSRVLDSEEMSRVRTHTLADPRYNSSNWWTTRRGIIELSTCYISLVHTLLFDETSPPARWEPDEFERSLRE
jgi:hypothetical protein